MQLLGGSMPQQRYSILLAPVMIAKVQLLLEISSASATATIITPKSGNSKNIIPDSELHVSTTVLTTSLTPPASPQPESGGIPQYIN
jgi:hypothetical protein